ncbi:MAG TPA: hypothetical protein VFX76_19185, partial [Roseiflexaceae bacterium]|nr:hypothetical protein [Roseiflexaceae bacterium]
DEALAAIWELVATANKYVVDVKPWVLAKSRADAAAEARLATTLYNLVETLRLIAYAIAPFLPGTAERVAAQVGIAFDTQTSLCETLLWARYPAGTRIQPGEVLFPKQSSTDDR